MAQRLRPCDSGLPGEQRSYGHPHGPTDVQDAPANRQESGPDQEAATGNPEGGARTMARLRSAVGGRRSAVGGPHKADGAALANVRCGLAGRQRALPAARYGIAGALCPL
ncbi:hypothetical protein GCM10010295_49900 [Streptomyces intermedius]